MDETAISVQVWNLGKLALGGRQTAVTVVGALSDGRWALSADSSLSPALWWPDIVSTLRSTARRQTARRWAAVWKGKLRGQILTRVFLHSGPPDQRHIFPASKGRTVYRGELKGMQILPGKNFTQPRTSLLNLSSTISVKNKILIGTRARYRLQVGRRKGHSDDREGRWSQPIWEACLATLTKNWLGNCNSNNRWSWEPRREFEIFLSKPAEKLLIQIVETPS